MPWDFYVVAAVRIKCEDWALKCEDLKLSFGWVDPQPSIACKKFVVLTNNSLELKYRVLVIVFLTQSSSYAVDIPPAV